MKHRRSWDHWRWRDVNCDLTQIRDTHAHTHIHTTELRYDAAGCYPKRWARWLIGMRRWSGLWLAGQWLAPAGARPSVPRAAQAKWSFIHYSQLSDGPGQLTNWLTTLCADDCWSHDWNVATAMPHSAYFDCCWLAIADRLTATVSTNHIYRYLHHRPTLESCSGAKITPIPSRSRKKIASIRTEAETL